MSSVSALFVYHARQRTRTPFISMNTNTCCVNEPYSSINSTAVAHLCLAHSSWAHRVAAGDRRGGGGARGVGTARSRGVDHFFIRAKVLLSVPTRRVKMAESQLHQHTRSERRISAARRRKHHPKQPRVSGSHQGAASLFCLQKWHKIAGKQKQKCTTRHNTTLQQYNSGGWYQIITRSSGMSCSTTTESNSSAVRSISAGSTIRQCPVHASSRNREGALTYAGYMAYGGVR